MKKKFTLFAMLAITSLAGCEKFRDYLPDPGSHSSPKSKPAVAVDWYKLECRLLLQRNNIMNGVYFGYLGIALYEAVRYENPNAASFESVLDQMPEMPKATREGYDWVLSGNAAMAALLRAINTSLTPAELASIDSLEAAYIKKSGISTGSEKFQRSVDFGKSVAEAIRQWYLTDNFNPSNAGYTPPSFFGAWVPTPPAYANGVMPYIGGARTYLASNSDFAYPEPPYAYSENKQSGYYKMVKNVYNVSKKLTTEQKNIALFYVDQGNGLGYTPAGHDLSVVAQLVDQKKVGLVTAAEALAKAGIAERDATIVCFRKK